jgi:hypothetical protein
MGNKIMVGKPLEDKSLGRLKLRKRVLKWI